MNEKIIIYQVLPRLFGNTKGTNKKNGSLNENGVGKFSSFSEKALSAIKEMSISHIWYTGVLEHATKTNYSHVGIKQDNQGVVKGVAGSPYAIKDYYDVCPDLADCVGDRMEEFESLIQRTHDADLKVIIDFVPNHVARQYYSDVKPNLSRDLGQDDNNAVSFSPNNNFYYLPEQKLSLDFVDVEYDETPAKATGNNVFSNNPSINDWYETVKLNYGVDIISNSTTYFDPIPDTWYKMKDILLFWASKGIDGFRCDMAEMVPAEFWGWVIPAVKREYSNTLFIAEVYNPSEYSNYVFNAKFDYLYDKVDLYDTIRDVIVGNKPSSEITFSWQRVEAVQNHMLNFLENHDEQRIASDFFAKDSQKGIPGLIVSALMNRNPFMIYSGQELGEKGMDVEGFSGLDGRTTIFDYWSVKSTSDWINSGEFDGVGLSSEQLYLRQQYIDILHLAKNEECIYEGGFYDLMYANYENENFDSTKQYAFIRSCEKEFLLIVANFSEENVQISVNIPDELYPFIGSELPNGVPPYMLLYGDAISTHKVENMRAIPVNVKSSSGAIIKFCL